MCIYVFHFSESDFTPTLKEFVSFPTADRKINLADKIGVHYCGFGVLLLDDDDGDQVTSIEKELGRMLLISIAEFSDCGCRGKGESL